jgi:hypothetical protein
MRLIDADILIQKRWQVKQIINQPDIYVIGQGFIMDAPTINVRKGVTQFVAEFTKQSYEDASEYNCEMIDWIMSCIEQNNS